MEQLELEAEERGYVPDPELEEWRRKHLGRLVYCGWCDVALEPDYFNSEEHQQLHDDDRF